MGTFLCFFSSLFSWILLIFYSNPPRWINTVSGDERGPARQLISTPFTRDTARKKWPHYRVYYTNHSFNSSAIWNVSSFLPLAHGSGEKEGAVNSSISPTSVKSGPKELNPGPPLQSLILGTLSKSLRRPLLRGRGCRALGRAKNTFRNTDYLSLICFRCEWNAGKM